MQGGEEKETRGKVIQSQQKTTAVSQRSTGGQVTAEIDGELERWRRLAYSKTLGE